MNNKNTGTPAFPALEAHRLNYGDSGMTLRDYFAAKAMESFLSLEGGTLEKDAELAYKMADAMLRARSNT